MEVSRQCCRLCLSTADFNVSLFSNYCQRTNMLEKIMVCLKLVIEQSEYITTICYKCANNVERYYDFLVSVKKSQTKLESDKGNRRILHVEPRNVNGRHVTMTSRMNVREQVIDADYTFSFLDISKEEKPETLSSSPLFSYFSPPNLLVKQSNEPSAWKTPHSRFNLLKPDKKREDTHNKRCKIEKPRHHSRDLFESQSQDMAEADAKSLDWKITPDESLIRRVREKCFGRSDF